MKKGLAMKKMASMVTVTIMVGVGFQIMDSLNNDVDKNNIEINSVYPEIDYPYCSDLDTGQSLDKDEFSRLLFYRLNGNCEITEQTVTVDFVIENKTISSEVRDLGLEDSNGDLYLYYRDNCNQAEDLNLDGLKIGKENQKILFQKDEQITLKGTEGEVTIC